MKKRWKYIRDFFILFFIIAWTLFLFKKNPEQIVESIGLHNGYLIVFFFSLLGGLATITVVTVYPIIIVFALGGLNPLILGISAGLGMTIANLVYFYFGLKVREVGEDYSQFRKRINLIMKWLRNKPDWIISIFVFFYVGFTPFPNNLLTVSGGLLDYPFKKILLPLIAGNLILMTFIAYLGSLGIGLFF